MLALMHAIQIRKISEQGRRNKTKAFGHKKIRKFSEKRTAVVLAADYNASRLTAVEHMLMQAQHMIHRALQSTVEQAELSVMIVTAAFTRLLPLS